MPRKTSNAKKPKAAPIPPAPASAPQLVSGSQALQGTDPEFVAMLTEEILAHASRAREDIVEFIEFVMRDFSTNKTIKVAPHQRVALEFIMAHDRCALMFPIGFTKTFLSTALTLYYLGRDPTERGAVVSASEEQASKIVQMVRDYIEKSVELQMVFPHLTRSTRHGDPWTQTVITIDRPPGIKDASLTAYGLNSDRIQGTRLSWVIIDDVLNLENTATPEARRKTKEFLDSSVLSRLRGEQNPRCVFTNTPWHPDDAIMHVSAFNPDPQGPQWATMRMDAYGDIEVYDDGLAPMRAERRGVPFKPWDSDSLRPKSDDPTDPACRLSAHDPDPTNEKLLWPERLDEVKLEEIRRTTLPHVFNQQIRCIVRDDGRSMCKQEYVDRCLKVARDLGIYTMTERYTGPNLTFTGLDLAISPGEEHDDTAFFTFEARPGGLNVILDIEIGQWSGPDILDKLLDKLRRYNSVARVENNAAQQYLIDFALRISKDLPIDGHCTGRTKAHPEHGIPGLFLEMSHGAWAFPNTRDGFRHPNLQKFIDACLYYSPSRHTSDVLMSNYFAREQKKAWMGLGVADPNAPSGGASIMTR